ncbi:MAG: carcinine hydrolase/isopenicillin-N N-acyltransferase family protein [Chloroflexota bacterium]
MNKKKRKYISISTRTIFTACMVGLLFTVIQGTFTQSYSGGEKSDQAIHADESFPGSCTTFTASNGEDVLFGNNEDFSNPDTYLWTVPSGYETYGGIYFGYRVGYPQGGMNEKGLAFDALALPEAKLNPRPELPSRGRSDALFLARIMEYNATVDEAISFAEGFNWGAAVGFQVLLADAAGSAVIISAGTDGEIAFTRKPEGEGHLVGTNFNRANPENRFGQPPCLRYDTAQSMLVQGDDQDDLSVDHFKAILDAVHVEGVKENTLYSNIFDLRHGVIYLYYWHQYDEVVRLNVKELIKIGSEHIRISELFPQEMVIQAEEEYQRHVDRAARDRWLNQNGKIVIVGGGFIVVGLIGLLIAIKKRRISYDSK